MPELAEIKIMADFINLACRERNFTSISFSESAMNRKLGIIQPTDLQIFSITAESRGKELMLSLIQGGGVFMKISCSMGMSGHWTLCHRDDVPKHTHMKFNTIDQHSLCLVDTRRFARWKVATDWSQNRGPCPVHEFSKFKENILGNLEKREFSKPIHLVLMNQKYFNGIGNYLRAEILFHAAQDPFVDARTAITMNSKILDLCAQLPREAYFLGGGQLKDWENPFQVPEGGFDEWMQCYGKGTSVVDKNGRRMWFHVSQLETFFHF
jgi:endonuclease VIII-like 1